MNQQLRHDRFWSPKTGSHSRSGSVQRIAQGLDWSPDVYEAAFLIDATSSSATVAPSSSTRYGALRVGRVPGELFFLRTAISALASRFSFFGQIQVMVIDPIAFKHLVPRRARHVFAAVLVPINLWIFPQHANLNKWTQTSNLCHHSNPAPSLSVVCLNGFQRTKICMAFRLQLFSLIFYLKFLHGTSVIFFLASARCWLFAV